MTAAVELVLVARSAVRKWHHAGQPALGQQLQSSIHGGKPDLAVSFLDQAEEFVSGEMVARIEERAKDSVALLGMFQAYAFQVTIENILGFAHGFARRRSMIVNAALQHMKS